MEEEPFIIKGYELMVIKELTSSILWDYSICKTTRKCASVI